MSLEKIYYLIELKNYTKAREYIKEFLSENPQSCLALSYLAKCEMELGDLKRAADLLDSSLSIEPAHVYSLLLKARLFFINKEYKKVIEICKVVLGHEPDNHFAHVHIATAFFNCGEYKLSEKHVNRSLELKPDFEFALLLKAEIGYVFDQDSKANKLVNQSLQINPENYDSRIVLGRRELTYSNYSNARKYFEEALSLNPVSKTAQKGLLTAIKGDYNGEYYDLFQRNAFGYYQRRQQNLSEKISSITFEIITLFILPIVWLFHYLKWYTYVVYDLFFFFNKKYNHLFRRNEKRRIYFFMIWHIIIICFFVLKHSFPLQIFNNYFSYFWIFIWPLPILGIFELENNKHILIAASTLIALFLTTFLFSGQIPFWIIYINCVSVSTFFVLWRNKIFIQIK